MLGVVDSFCCDGCVLACLSITIGSVLKASADTESGGDSPATGWGTHRLLTEPSCWDGLFGDKFCELFFPLTEARKPPWRNFPKKVRKNYRIPLPGPTPEDREKLPPKKEEK